MCGVSGLSHPWRCRGERSAARNTEHRRISTREGSTPPRYSWLRRPRKTRKRGSTPSFASGPEAQDSSFLTKASNVQLSPANMGFFSSMMPMGSPTGESLWAGAWSRPGSENIIGGVLVALAFWCALRPSDRIAQAATTGKGGASTRRILRRSSARGPLEVEIRSHKGSHAR